MSRALNVICVENSIKNFIIQEIENSSLSGNEKESQISFLKSIPLCGKGTPIEVEIAKARRKGAKRAPSAYNQFIGQCMKGKGIKKFGQASGAMKECAGEWRKRKGS